jgi:hypothetical protein
LPSKKQYKAYQMLSINQRSLIVSVCFSNLRIFFFILLMNRQLSKMRMEDRIHYKTQPKKHHEVKQLHSLKIYQIPKKYKGKRQG